MATGRPTVSVYKWDDPEKKVEALPIPAAMLCGLRPDLVNFVHAQVNKNRRQAHGVKYAAGRDCSAESWGTGRAVARIPRAQGGGTHRAGQGAFGNMCRGGGMFAPLRTWRRWHRKVGIRRKRHAAVSALSASCVVPLVMARGHRISEVPELPLVLDDDLTKVFKTQLVKKTLSKFGMAEDLKRCEDGHHKRPGKGKARNKKWIKRKGPLIIYHGDEGIVRACVSLRGVDTMHVSKMNILNLAPGGQFGRMLIWTRTAFNMVQEMFGSHNEPGTKSNYRLPRQVMENADLFRIINSTEIQSALRPRKEPDWIPPRKVNAFNSQAVMDRLNPYAEKFRHERKQRKIPGTPEYEAIRAKRRKIREDTKAYKAKLKEPDSFFRKFLGAFDPPKKEESEEGSAEEE